MGVLCTRRQLKTGVEEPALCLARTWANAPSNDSNPDRRVGCVGRDPHLIFGRVLFRAANRFDRDFNPVAIQLRGTFTWTPYNVYRVLLL